MHLGRLWSYIQPLRLRQNIYAAYTYIYTGYYARYLRQCGTRTRFKPHFLNFKGGQYISIGNECTFMQNCILTAWDSYRSVSLDFVEKESQMAGKRSETSSEKELQHFTPSITIGNNCSIGAGSHITAINSITLGDNVLTGPYVLISDNAHGEAERRVLDIAPTLRPLYTKGEVVIEDNVWIGQGAMVLPGVHIGQGVIIAANSVVTHDIPAYSLAAGTPAKVIKRME